MRRSPPAAGAKSSPGYIRGDRRLSLAASSRSGPPVGMTRRLVGSCPSPVSLPSDRGGHLCPMCCDVSAERRNSSERRSMGLQPSLSKTFKSSSEARPARKTLKSVYIPRDTYSTHHNERPHVLPHSTSPSVKSAPVESRPKQSPRTTAASVQTMPIAIPPSDSNTVQPGRLIGDTLTVDLSDRHRKMLFFLAAVFVLLLSGGMAVYYVWYSHEEYEKHHRLVHEVGLSSKTTEVAADKTEPLDVWTYPAPTPSSLSTTNREMYFATPFGMRKRALKLRRNDDITSTEENVELVSRKKRCMTRYCQERADYIVSHLNWTVGPCSDFYAFACSRWSLWHSQQPSTSVETLLVEDVERELYLTFSTKLKEEVWKIESLVDECLQRPLPKSSLLHLRNLMKAVGLYGWPYRSDTKTRGEVWKAAALILRHLNLAALIAVTVDSNPYNVSEYIISLNEPGLLIGQYSNRERRLPRWYASAVNTAFKQFTPGRYLDIADRVNDFSHKLAEVTTVRGLSPFMTSTYKLAELRTYSSYSQYLGYVFDDIRKITDRTPLLVKCDRYLRSLKSVLHTTRNHDVMNYLGFRVLIHLSPFLTEESREFSSIRMKEITGRRRNSWPRWRRCIRMAEQVAPEIFAFAYAKAVENKVERHAVFKLAREVATIINRTIGNFSWMADMDKENARTVAASIDIEAFYPSWMSNSSYREAYDSMFPDITRGNIMKTYRDFVQKMTEGRLALVNKRDDGTFKLAFWRSSVFDVRPRFDYKTMTIYIPPVIFNTSYTRGDVSLAVQIPFVGPKLISAYLEGIHEKSFPPYRYHWSLNSTVRAIELELCLSRQYANWTTGDHDNKMPSRRTLTLQYDYLDNIALEGALQVYLKYISLVKSQNLHDGAFLSPGNLTSVKLFYVLYAEGMCENAESERQRAELDDDPISCPRARVNVPLRNYPDFAADWECRSRTPMAPRKRCNLWLS